MFHIFLTQLPEEKVTALSVDVYIHRHLLLLPRNKTLRSALCVNKSLSSTGAPPCLKRNKPIKLKNQHIPSIWAPSWQLSVLKCGTVISCWYQHVQSFQHQYQQTVKCYFLLFLPLGFTLLTDWFLQNNPGYSRNLHLINICF